MPPSGLQLVPGPYGFSIPAGWHSHLLANYGGSGSWASFTRGPAAAPFHAAAPYSVQYFLWGGSGLIYSRAGNPVLSQAAKDTLCPATAWHAISANAISFTCAPVAGIQPRGVLIVEPRPGGTKQLLVTLPGTQQPTATAILNSFR
jgi:hypothetical protein